MKKLSKHTLLYDKDCPLCDLYTSAMVRHGVLDQEGRIPYHRDCQKEFPGIDAERARNEIALVNRETGDIAYGMNALQKIFENTFPALGKIMGIRPVKGITQALYTFISRNRKVISPGHRDGHYSCVPDPHFTARWIYVLGAAITTGLILNWYTPPMYELLLGKLFPGWTEYVVCLGQIVFQGSAIALLRNKMTMDYLGNMATVSLLGALAFMPVFVLVAFGVEVNAVLRFGYFTLVVGMMFMEHRRRVRILGAPGIMTAFWVLYRVIGLVVLATV